MQQIFPILKQLGLTQTEIKIYITGLNYYDISVNELVKQTGLNRTTIYHALGTLSKKALIAKKSNGNKLLFIMTKPDRIGNLLDEKISFLKKQKEEVSALVPLLLHQLNQVEYKVNVSHYEGIEGVKLVIEDALYCKSRHWDVIAPIDNFFSQFDPNYKKYFMDTRRSRGLTTRSLWERKDSQKKLTAAQIKERNPRILPEVMFGKFRSVICIYDDKLLIINSLKEITAVLVQSKEIHDTILAVFEGLWINSKPLR